ncbi:class I adenylate-forming enzyme family protein [Microbacterium sp. NPDC089695]|uniref:class I adenylate-forming enzyme family protein n=1 Tax=Microbacterium sp. NPDC089695 TaxID=3364198 RepID=UPI00381BE078
MTAAPLDRGWSLLRKSLRDGGDRVAVIAGDTAMTYRQLDDEVRAVASYLTQELEPGARVALLLGTTPTYLVADLAVMRAGLVKIPVNPMLDPDDIAYIAGHSGASILLVTRDLEPRLAGVAREIERAGCRLVVLDDEAVRTHVHAAPAVPSRDADAAADGVILYTGGTSGRPKGVVHSQASVAATVLTHIVEAEVRSDEVMLLASALSHSAGLFAQAALARGATVVLQEKFDAEAYLRLIAAHGVTFLSVVPTMLYRILDAIGAADDAPGVRTIVYGSAPITPARLAQAIDLFGPVLVQLFGQSECPNFGTTLTKSDHLRALREPALLGSCGRASTLAEVAIGDPETGRRLPRGEVGEVLLRAPYVMDRYLDAPEATAESLRDGWVHTRDLGLMDDDGYVHLKDRLSDLIITGGYNVYPSEIERVLEQHPGVDAVAVVGLRDDDWGELVCAVVVPNGVVDPVELTAWSRERLGAYKRPKRVEVRGVLPLTPFGKVDKKALRREYSEETR